MLLDLTCKLCGGSFPQFEVNEEAYKAWQGGRLIQNVMPALTADQREMLISGTCPRCWDNLFPEEEDEEDISEMYTG